LGARTCCALNRGLRRGHRSPSMDSVSVPSAVSAQPGAATRQPLAAARTPMRGARPRRGPGPRKRRGARATRGNMVDATAAPERLRKSFFFLVFGTGQKCRPPPPGRAKRRPPYKQAVSKLAPRQNSQNAQHALPEERPAPRCGARCEELRARFDSAFCAVHIPNVAHEQGQRKNAR